MSLKTHPDTDDVDVNTGWRLMMAKLVKQGSGKIKKTRTHMGFSVLVFYSIACIFSDHTAVILLSDM